MISRRGRRAIELPIIISAAGTVMLPTIVTGRAIISGVRMPNATSKAAAKAPIRAGLSRTLGLNWRMLYSPLISMTPAVKMKKVLGTLSRAA